MLQSSKNESEILLLRGLIGRGELCHLKGRCGVGVSVSGTEVCDEGDTLNVFPAPEGHTENELCWHRKRSGKREWSSNESHKKGEFQRGVKYEVETQQFLFVIHFSFPASTNERAT